jgi:hypothetical protein
MYPSGRGLVVGSYVTFCVGVGCRQLCAFQLGGWWFAVMCPGRGLVEGSYMPF